MIDFVVDGGLPEVSMAVRAQIAIANGDAARSHIFECIPAPRNQFRVTVALADDEDRRFMWSLVEGAVLQVSMASTMRRDCESHRKPPFSFLAANGAILLEAGPARPSNHAVQANSSTI